MNFIKINNDIISISFINNSLLYNLSFINVNAQHDNHILNIKISSIFINYYQIYNNSFENYIFLLDQSYFFINNSIFDSCTLIKGILLFENSNNFTIIHTIFENILGERSLISASNVISFKITSCLLKNISVFYLFDVDTIISLTISNSTIILSTFGFILNDYMKFSSVKFIGGEIAYNFILKGLLWNLIRDIDAFFLTIYIHDNRYSSQTSIRIAIVNSITMNEVIMIHNFFLFPDH